MSITDTIEAAKEIYPEQSSLLDMIVYLSIQERAVFQSWANRSSIVPYNNTTKNISFIFKGGVGPSIIDQADYLQTLLENQPSLYKSKGELKYNTGSLNVSARWNPSPLQQGNQFVRGLGAYNNIKKTDIVSTYNELLDYNMNFDTPMIANYFLKFSRTGHGPSPDDLWSCGFKDSRKQKKAVNFTNRLALLYSVIEPSRRIHPGKLFVSRNIFQLPELPFATTYAMTCKQMGKEILDFDDVFSDDANFGPFTKVAFSDCHTSRILLSRTRDIAEKIGDITESYITDVLQEKGEGELFERNDEDDRLILTDLGVQELLEDCYKPPEIIKIV